MRQITIFDELNDMMKHGLLGDMDLPRKRRDTILVAQEAANGEDFGRRMREHIVAHLKEHGPSSGEAITDAAKSKGIVPPRGDDRAYGGSYMSLSKRGVIVKAGFCQRAKGHATGGGVVWAINPNKQ